MPRSVKHGGKKVFRYRALKNASKAKSKALKKKRKMNSQCKQIAENWDESKTMQANLADMGIAFDPNRVVPIKQHALAPRPIATDDVMETEAGNVAEARKLGSVAAQLGKSKKAKGKKGKKAEQEQKPAKKVISSLEEEAAEIAKAQAEAGPKTRLGLLDRDIEFCVYMLEKHGDDYKAMSRDPKNLFQDTPKQLARKIRVYKESPFFKAIEGMETA